MNPLTPITSDGRLDHYPGFLDAERSDQLFERLWQSSDWRTASVRVMGRVHPTPRLIAYFGEVPYRYSGQTHDAKPPSAGLLELKRDLEERLKTQFNSILLNAYRDGRDSISWHADNERELGDAPTIASLSLGATRRFLVRHRRLPDRRSFTLCHGDLVVMSGPFQTHWQHAIPKTKQQVGVRINLTFRNLLPHKVA